MRGVLVVLLRQCDDLRMPETKSTNQRGPCLKSCPALSALDRMLGGEDVTSNAIPCFPQTATISFLVINGCRSIWAHGQNYDLRSPKQLSCPTWLRAGSFTPASTISWRCLAPKLLTPMLRTSPSAWASIAAFQLSARFCGPPIGECNR